MTDDNDVAADATSAGIGHNNPPALPDRSEGLPLGWTPDMPTFEGVPKLIAEQAWGVLQDMVATEKRMKADWFRQADNAILLKQLVGHGRFLQAVERVLGWSADKAEYLIKIGENLGGDEFRIIRNLRVNVTTLDRLARAPEDVRYAIAEEIENGRYISATGDRLLDAEIKRRIVEATSDGGGFAKANAKEQREAKQEAAAIQFRALIETKFEAGSPEFKLLVGLFNRAGGRVVGRILRTKKPVFDGPGFFFKEPTDHKTGLPLTDDQLQDARKVQAVERIKQLLAHRD